MKKAGSKKRIAALGLSVLMLAACLVLPGCLKRDPGETQAAPDIADTTSAIADTQVSVSAPAEVIVSDVTEQIASETTAPAPVEHTGYINFNKERVNIRADHNTDAEIVGRVESFERITVTETYTDSTAKENLRYWGKITVDGITGWVALYYLTPLEIADTVNDAAALNALWTRLNGCWNTADRKQCASFLSEDGKKQFAFFYWYSEIDFTAEPKAPFTGDVNGIVKLDITIYPFDYFEEPEPVDGFLYIDLSNADEGRIKINDGDTDDWIECFYAGATMDDARPSLD